MWNIFFARLFDLLLLLLLLFCILICSIAAYFTKKKYRILVMLKDADDEPNERWVRMKVSGARERERKKCNRIWIRFGSIIAIIINNIEMGKCAHTHKLRLTLAYSVRIAILANSFSISIRRVNEIQSSQIVYVFPI